MEQRALKIGVDLRPLLSGRVSGVEVYMLEMLKAILALDKQNHYYLWVNSSRSFNFPEELMQENVTFLQTRWPNKLLNFATRYLGWPKYERFFPEKLDWLWVPDPRPVRTKETRLLVTFHDLTPERFPQFFNRKTRVWHKLVDFRRLAERATRIVAVSESTKADLMSYYKIPEGKVNVVYEGSNLKPASASEVQGVRDKYGLPERYILALSTLEPRKNLARLLHAFKTAQATRKFPQSLVVAGVSNEKIFAELSQFGSDERIIFTGFVNEKDKAALYSGADFLAYVSLFEGFGLPVCEALSCGVPGLVSDNSSLPEVLGAAGVLVDAERVSSISAGMLELLRDEEGLQRLRQVALAQSAKFSWQKAAGEVLKIFKE